MPFIGWNEANGVSRFDLQVGRLVNHHLFVGALVQHLHLVLDAMGLRRQNRHYGDAECKSHDRTHILIS
jgi:hypothetical protein